MRIIKNPDVAFFEAALKQLKDNDGYCPCSLTKDAAHKCPCKEFREQTTAGECHCGLYRKVEE